MLTARLEEVAAQVAVLLDDAEPDGEPTPAQRVLFDEAVGALRAGGAALLDAATPYLWEYYRDLADAAGEDDLGMAPLTQDADIWEHVTLSRRPLLMVGDGDAREPSPCYVNFEGEVSWEPEHGLQLVFDHAGAIARVGPYTGHLTVAAKYASYPPGEIYG